MGGLTSSRKRGDEFLSLNHGNFSPNIQSSSKRPRFSSMQKSGNPDRAVLSSKSAVARVSRYPEAKPPLPRVHAPCRPVKFGCNSAVSHLRRDPSPKSRDQEGCVNAVMGNFLTTKYHKVKNIALEACRFLQKDKEVIELDEEVVDIENTKSEDSSIEEVEVIEDDEPEANRAMPHLKELDLIVLDGSNQPSSSSVVSDLSNAVLKVQDLTFGSEKDISSVSAYKELLSQVQGRDSRLRRLSFDIELNEKRRSAIQSLRPKKEPVQEVPREPFIPLTEEEEAQVKQAFSVSNRRMVLVAHENSNIEITAQHFQCLRPGAWLNDEVINVYLELLKEREKRDPNKFLKCHFFNTFFYKKLISGNGYDYKSVRRWTTQRKLGYGLIDCDKIFVPVHKEIHWCLAVINKKEEKFQYLDSLKGKDTHVMKVLARYYADEVKDKSGKVINVSSWKHEFVEDLPEQENGFDCGVFMIKYADFYSRGLELCFSQEHMPYFRLRTAKEILRLKAH